MSDNSSIYSFPSFHSITGDSDSMSSDPEDGKSWQAEGTAYRSPVSLSRGGSIEVEVSPLTFPVHFASSTHERQIALASIQYCEEENRILWERARQTKNALREIHIAKLNNLRRLRALKWSVSTLSRIPDEILSEIFEIYVLVLACNPWVLTRISSKFRKAAFATRRIWTSIHVSKPNPKCSHKIRWEKGMEHCISPSHLKSALERSGQALLNIKISRCTIEMATMLVNEWHRCESLDISSRSIRKRTVMSILFAKAQSPAALRHVRSADPEDPQFQKWLEGTRPSSLYGSRWDLSSLSKISWWNELRDVRLNSLSGGVQTHLQSMLTSISNGITHLEIDGMARLEVSALCLPELLELKVSDVEGWWHFKCPNLIKLSVRTIYPIPPDATSIFPNLQELIFDAQSITLHSTLIRAPNLERLTLRHMGNGMPGHNFIWLDVNGNLSSAVPKKLLMDSCSMAYKPFLDSLRPCDELESLELTYSTLPSTFFKAFGTKPSKKSPMLCRNLREMIIHISPFHRRFDRERYCETFKNILTMRQRQGCPLTRLSVKWPSDRWEGPNEIVAQEFVPIQ